MKGIVIGGLAVAAVATGWGLTSSNAVDAAAVSADALYTVRRGSLTIAVVENGYLKAKNSEMLQPQFAREGTITWLAEEGSEVVEGDVLVEFDKTELKNQIEELKTSLIQFEMELEAARAELGIQERDNEAVVEKAELALQLKELALERYEKGDAPNELRKKILEKEKAASQYKRSQEKYAQVPELQAEGFLTKIQAEEERINLEEARINKENAERELELFQTYTEKMDLAQKQADVKDATRDLENAKIKASISLNEKQARVKQRELAVTTTKARIQQLEEELGHMTIRAPKPGTVHYGDPNRMWMRDQVKVGNRVHRGNTIITLPDLSVMQVLVQVHEADIDMVKEDMPVVVTVETHKGTSFPGKIEEIASVASSQSWEDSANKTFRVEITMEPIEVELRAGVTAKAEIQVEELRDVLQLPIHTVFPEGGKHYCYVYLDGEIERRQVSVGKNNAHYVVVTSGLAEGEQVLLYDPEEDGLPQIDQDTEGDGDEGGLPDLAGMESSS